MVSYINSNYIGDFKDKKSITRYNFFLKEQLLPGLAKNNKLY